MCVFEFALTSVLLVLSGAFYKECLRLVSGCEFYIFKLFINLQFFKEEFSGQKQYQFFELLVIEKVHNRSRGSILRQFSLQIQIKYLESSRKTKAPTSKSEKLKPAKALILVVRLILLFNN